MLNLIIANQKGGVGKTTTSIELATCMGQEDKKVLVVDLDQQGNLTKYSGVTETDKTIYDVLHAECPIKDSIIHEKYYDLIPSSPSLSRADREFIGRDDVFLLSDVFDIVKDEYDYAIVDTGPSRSILLTMAYVAADYIIIPTECDAGSIDGIKAIYGDLVTMRNERNVITHAKIMGIILNKSEKTIMHEDALEDIKNLEIEDEPFVMTVRKSIKTSEAKKLRKSLQEHERWSNTAIDYRAVSERIIGG